MVFSGVWSQAVSFLVFVKNITAVYEVSGYSIHIFLATGTVSVVWARILVVVFYTYKTAIFVSSHFLLLWCFVGLAGFFTAIAPIAAVAAVAALVLPLVARWLLVPVFYRVLAGRNLLLDLVFPHGLFEEALLFGVGDWRLIVARPLRILS